MVFTELLNLDHIRLNIECKSKKKLLEYSSQWAEQILNIPAQNIFNQLIERERVGTTALGQGVALPHCQIDCQVEPHLLMLRLESDIDFEAIDKQPVNLFFILLIAKQQEVGHYHTLLSDLSTILLDKTIIKALRNAESPSQFADILTQYQHDKETGDNS